MIFIHKETGLVVLVGFTVIYEYDELYQLFGKVMFAGKLMVIYEDKDLFDTSIVTASSFVEEFEFVGFF